MRKMAGTYFAKLRRDRRFAVFNYDATVVSPYIMGSMGIFLGTIGGKYRFAI